MGQSQGQPSFDDELCNAAVASKDLCNLGDAVSDLQEESHTMSDTAVSDWEHQSTSMCPKVHAQGNHDDSVINTTAHKIGELQPVAQAPFQASTTEHPASNENCPTAPPLHALAPPSLQRDEVPLLQRRQVRQASTSVVEGSCRQTLQGATETELESPQRDEGAIGMEPRQVQQSKADSARRIPILDLCAFIDGMSTNAIVCPEHALVQEIAAIAGIGTEGGDMDSLDAPGLRVGVSMDACGVLAYMLHVEGSTDTFPRTNVVKASIRAVQRLWPSCRVRMRELNMFRALGDVCMLHLGTMDIVIVGVEAISAIANEEDDKQALGSHRCNEFIVAALRVFSTSADVQRLACDAIVAMADDAANAAKMGEAGVVGTMAQLFYVFFEDSTTQEHGCKALQVLARDYNLLRSLTKAGLCDQLLRTLVHFKDVRSLQEAGMAAVVQLAYTADNMRKLGKHGGVEVVITALQAFPPGTEHRGVFEVALMLVRRLAMDQNNRRSLARQMAPQIVCRVLNDYAEDARIQEWGCAAISILALDEDMCEGLRACGGLLSATAALQKFVEDRAIQNVAKLVVRRLAAPPGGHSMPHGGSKRGGGGAGSIGDLGAAMPRGSPGQTTERQPKATQPGMRGAVLPSSPPMSCMPTRGAWPPRATLTPQASPFEPRQAQHAPRPALQQTSRLDFVPIADSMTQQLAAVLAQVDAGIVAPQSLVEPRSPVEGSMLSTQGRPAAAKMDQPLSLHADTEAHSPSTAVQHEALISAELRQQQLVEAMLTEAGADKLSSWLPSGPAPLQQPKSFRVAPGPPERHVDERWASDRSQTPTGQQSLQAEQHTSASVTAGALLLPSLQPPVLNAQVALQQHHNVVAATANQVMVTQRLMSGMTRLVDVGEVLQALSQIRTSITMLHPNSPLRVAAGLSVVEFVREDINVVDTADALMAIMDNSDMPAQVPSMAVLAAINLINPANPNNGPHRVRLRALGLIKVLLRAIARHPTECPDLLDHVFICLCLVSSEGFHHARDALRTIMHADTAGLFREFRAMDLFIGPMQRTLRAHGGHLAVQHGFLMFISAWWTHNAEARKEQLNMSEGSSTQLNQDGMPQPGEKSNAIAFYGQAISLVLSAMKSLSKGPHIQCQGSFYLAEVGSAREAFYSTMVQEGACDVVASALGALHPSSAKCCQKNVLRVASVLAARPRGREALRCAGGGELLVRAYCTLECGWDVLSYAGMGVLSLAHEGAGMRQMVHVGAIEVVVAMMRAYGNDRTWQTPAARWLHRVAMDDNESRSRLIRSGSVPVLLQAMQRFRAPEDKDVQADCVGALFCMTRQGGMAIHGPLVEAGLVGLLTFALCTYPTHQPLVTRVIPFLSLLASNGAASYPGKPSVREAVAVALSNLEGNAQVPPLQCEPLDALVAALRNFVNDCDVQHYGMDLVWMLAVFHPTNVIKLGVAGAPECAITVMRLFVGNVGPSGSACGALAALTEHVDNRLRMIEAGAVQAFFRELAAFPTHKEIQKIAIRGALKLLNDEANIRRAGGWERHGQDVMSARDACEPLLKALHSYPLELDIQFAGCWVVWKLASHCSERRKVLGQLGAGELLVAALWSSSFRREVQYVCCGALYAMAEDEPRARNAVEQATTSYQLLEAALRPFAMGQGQGAPQAPGTVGHEAGIGEVGKWLLGVKEENGDKGAVRRKLIRCGARAAVEAAKVTWRGDEQISSMADMALSRLV